MTEKQLIDNLLNIPNSEMFSAESRISTLTIALRGSRKLSGRNLDTGKLITENEKLDKLIEEMQEGRYYSSLFIGLTNYLILLDLFGILFTKNKKSKVPTKDGIMNALNNFTDLETNKKKAIKGLRNSLAHNFSLANKNYNYSLSYEYHTMIEIIENKSTIESKGKHKILVNINEVELCTLIENIYSKIISLHLIGEIQLTMSENEIKNRFTIK